MSNTKYTEAQLIELGKKNRKDLDPSEFLALWHYVNKSTGDTNAKPLNSDAELFNVFQADTRSLRSANQFKLAVARAGLSMSHKRAAELYPIFKQRLGL